MSKHIVWIYMGADGEISEKTLRQAPRADDIRQAVGGAFALVPGEKDGKVGELYVNDEGWLQGLPTNYAATALYWAAVPDERAVGNDIAGNAVFIQKTKA